MSAAAIIERVRASGGEITLAADGIKIRVPASLRDRAVAEVKAHKAAIRFALKAETGDAWDPDDYRAFYDQVAGMLEFDNRLPHQKAEAFAFECCVTEWLNRNFEESPPGRCVHCGGGKRRLDPLLPLGIERTGYIWLHSGCREAWHANRRAKAFAALAEVGITQPRPLTAAEAIISIRPMTKPNGA
jgi:hypothetical protein